MVTIVTLQINPVSETFIRGAALFSDLLLSGTTIWGTTENAPGQLNLKSFLTFPPALLIPFALLLQYHSQVKWLICLNDPASSHNSVARWPTSHGSGKIQISERNRLFVARWRKNDRITAKSISKIYFFLNPNPKGCCIFYSSACYGF